VLIIKKMTTLQKIKHDEENFSVYLSDSGWGSDIISGELHGYLSGLRQTGSTNGCKKSCATGADEENDG
jgi:hypothetical protein